MKQISLAQSGFEIAKKTTRKRIFLEEMNKVVPWQALVALIEPHAPPADPGRQGGRPSFSVEIMLRIYFLAQWFGLSDLALEEALQDVPLFRDFAGLDLGSTRIPDETTILRFRHLMERHNIGQQIMDMVKQQLSDAGFLLKAGTAVDATLIAAPSSTKNSTGRRDPEMHSTKKGKNYHFGMKVHIDVDASSGLVHTVCTTAANVHDVTQASQLLHGEEGCVFADSGYRGVEKRPEIQAQAHQPRWQVAMMPSKRKALDPNSEIDAISEKIEKLKASVRAKVEHPFRVIKCQFGYRKTRYKGLAKNAMQVVILFALSNLWMARRLLLMPNVPA